MTDRAHDDGDPAPPLTPEAYAAAKGVRCPACGHDDVEGGPVEVDEGGARQEISCVACPATWTDVYTLVGYEDLER